MLSLVVAKCTDTSGCRTDEAHAPAVEADGDLASGRLQLIDLVIDHEQFPNGGVDRVLNVIFQVNPLLNRSWNPCLVV